MSQDLPVARIMQRGLLTCSPDTLLCEAAERMANHSCSSILVVEAEQPVGIWTEHDALSVDFSSPESVRVPIRDVMTYPVATLLDTTSVGEAAIRFREEQRCHFLIIDESGLPAGILSQSDAARNQGLDLSLHLHEVSEAIINTPLTLNGELCLPEATQAMRQTNCDAAVVICKSRKLGILTKRDLVRFIAHHPGDTPIGELASRPLQRVRANDMLTHARDLLLDSRIRHLAVTDDNQQVMGLLSVRDLLAGAEHLHLEDLRLALEQRDHALAQSRQHLRLAKSVMESSLEGIIITDGDNRIEFANPAFTRLTGYTSEDIVGRSPGVLASGRHDAAFYREMWEAINQHGCWHGEIWNRRKSGEMYLDMLTITAIGDEKGKPTHYAWQFRDITHIRENEEQIRKLAYYDPLTRLPNRRLLEDRLSLAIRHAHRNDQRLAVLVFDLDHFKQVNDTLGHEVGDELLLLVSDRLRDLLREDDTLARLGGDEFVVLLPDLESIEEIIRIARRLIDAICEPCIIGPHEFRIGSSLGISLYPDDETSAEGLIRNADAAMYRAKQEGRNTYRLYTTEMNFQASNQLALETALRNTVESGEGLEMFYQPLFERSNGALHSAEALLRWHHPERGSISPSEFIPLAERSGLIVPLGKRVIHMVCQQLKEWLGAGLAPVPVAINLSARQFWQAGLPTWIRERLEEYQLAPELVGFELTESTLLDKCQDAIAILQALRELGCPGAIDDFGTGYSSLSYLQELPVTTMKIDQSFIQPLESGQRRDGAIVAAVSGLARELGLKVVAEGVENEAQWDALAHYPIDLVQGFLTGRPVNAERFEHDYLRPDYAGFTPS